MKSIRKFGQLVQRPFRNFFVVSRKYWKIKAKTFGSLEKDNFREAPWKEKWKNVTRNSRDENESDTDREREFDILEMRSHYKRPGSWPHLFIQIPPNLFFLLVSVDTQFVQRKKKVEKRVEEEEAEKCCCWRMQMESELQWNLIGDKSAQIDVRDVNESRKVINERKTFSSLYFSTSNQSFFARQQLLRHCENLDVFAVSWCAIRRG